MILFPPIQFGSIIASTSSASAMSSLVSDSQFKPITIRVMRNDLEKRLVLTPQPWSGRGLLGYADRFW